jgi:hypothetical protein
VPSEVGRPPRATPPRPTGITVTRNTGTVHAVNDVVRQIRRPETVRFVSPLPDGWTLERVRAIEPSAVLLDVSPHVVFASESEDYEELPPARCILSFSGLCLVQVEGDDEWWMGQPDESDGSIVC